MLNETVPKQRYNNRLISLAFVPVLNETVPKQLVSLSETLAAFVPVLNETVPKPRSSLFSFQQLTINISSPIVVTRAFARHCGSN